jgi:hypothetical protein
MSFADYKEAERKLKLRRPEWFSTENHAPEAKKAEVAPQMADLPPYRPIQRELPRDGKEAAAGEDWDGEEPAEITAEES